MPTVIVWAHGGSHVELEGSFDNWTQRYTMQRSGKDFTLVKLLPPGVYQVRGVPLVSAAARGAVEGLCARELLWLPMRVQDAAPQKAARPLLLP